MARELHNEDVWRQCGFTRPPERRTLDRFITDFALVAEDVFITLVHELAEQVPLGKLYRIDGTDIPVDHQDDDDAEWNYDHAEDDFYYGYGCCLVTAADNIPVAATFTPAKKVDQETAMRVTSDALAVEKPIWMLGDAEFDMLDWHDRLLEQGVVPVAPYNQRNADDPLDIEYRIEDTIAVSEQWLDDTYRKRSRIETAIGVCKDLGLETHGSEAESESNLTSSWRCVFGLRLRSQTMNETTISPVRPSRYENCSAPPPTPRACS
jgi:hypothetical protein